MKMHCSNWQAFPKWTGLVSAILFLLVQIPLHATIAIEAWTTGNGARVFFVQTHNIPILDVSVDFDAGSRYDPQNRAGLSSMTNMLLAGGIAASRHPSKEPALTEAAISEGFADIGAQYSVYASPDRAGVRLRMLSDQEVSGKAVTLLARMLAQPSFPDSQFQRDRKRAISAIRESLTQPDAIAARAFMEVLYGTHPYAFSPTPETLASIRRSDLVSFHAAHYVAETAVISIVGDASRERAEAIAEELSMRLKRSRDSRVSLELPEVEPGLTRESFIAHPSVQSHILIGMPALARGDPDFFALTVGNYILGSGGFVSRLMQEVREKRGLSYSVYSQFDPRIQKGPFIIGLQTKTEQTEEAVAVARDTLEAFMRDGPTQAELKSAISHLVDSFPLRKDNNSKVLSLVSTIGFYGLPLDYLNSWPDRIQEVGIQDVRDAFSRKLLPGQLSTVIVGQKPE